MQDVTSTELRFVAVCVLPCLQSNAKGLDFAMETEIHVWDI